MNMIRFLLYGLKELGFIFLACLWGAYFLSMVLTLMAIIAFSEIENGYYWGALYYSPAAIVLTIGEFRKFKEQQ